jgi:hypothetical protein
VKVGKRLDFAIPAIELLQCIENDFADLDERWTDSHRTPVAEGSLADLPAIALNNFLKSENIGLDGGTKERLVANLCNGLLRISICMRLRINGHRGDSSMCRRCSAAPAWGRHSRGSRA